MNKKRGARHCHIKVKMRRQIARRPAPRSRHRVVFPSAFDEPNSAASPRQTLPSPALPHSLAVAHHSAPSSSHLPSLPPSLFPPATHNPSSASGGAVLLQPLLSPRALGPRHGGKAKPTPPECATAPILPLPRAAAAQVPPRGSGCAWPRGPPFGRRAAPASEGARGGLSSRPRLLASRAGLRRPPADEGLQSAYVLAYFWVEG